MLFFGWSVGKKGRAVSLKNFEGADVFLRSDRKISIGFDKQAQLVADVGELFVVWRCRQQYDAGFVGAQIIVDIAVTAGITVA